MKSKINTAHPAALLPILLVAILFIGQSVASAALNTNPTPSLPFIGSYEPAKGMVGEKVMVNVNYGNITNRTAVSNIELANGFNGRISVSLNQETPNVFSFIIPSGAASGAPRLVGVDGSRRDSAQTLQVVSSSQRPRGVTILNRTQYQVRSVKSGTTELLAANTNIGIGNARFVPLTLTTTPKTLDLGLVITNSNGTTTRVFTLREEVALNSLTALLGQSLTTLVLERLTVAEALGAVNADAEWKIFHRGQDRRMIVSPSGVVTLEDHFGIFAPSTSSNFQIEEVSWDDNSNVVLLALRSGSTRVSDVITLTAPFDSFAANKLGQFSNTDTLFLTPLPLAMIDSPVPMFVRRVR